MTKTRNDLRNIAIIAHVDHGKTTLVDAMLHQTNVFRANQNVAERVMDSNDLERERGITILAKNTSLWLTDEKTGDDVKVNIVDTPGHADFGGEVERILNMVDGVLLLVDAAEGPMPQTRFVLSKALEMGHKAVVVINKIDRKDADPERVLNETFDLFIELGATEEQADFPVVYTVATTGQAGDSPDVGPDLKPLFQVIVDEIPAPVVDVDAPLQMLVTTLDYDQYRGLTGLGRIFAGRMTAKQQIARITIDGDTSTEEVRYLFVYDGMGRTEVESAEAGEIVAIAGLEAISIGETLADPANPVALPPIRVEKPTVHMTFGVNTSPFAGLEGRWRTSQRLWDRLQEELKHNVALRVEQTDSADTFMVSGRGELHLSILIETMRREGYEFQVSRPEVITQTDEEGNLLEPYEEVHITVPTESMGTVIEMMGKRKGEMTNMSDTAGETVRLTYIVPTRGLLGFRYQFLTATKGRGILNSLFHGYKEFAGSLGERTRGSLVAWEKGTSTTYALRSAEDRGTLFVGPGVEVYAGMVVGEHQRAGDLDLNVCKAKELSAVRTVYFGVDDRLAPPREMSLEEFIEYLADDELLEVTPNNLRIRKRILDKNMRDRMAKKAKYAEMA